MGWHMRVSARLLEVTLVEYGLGMNNSGRRGGR